MTAERSYTHNFGFQELNAAAHYVIDAQRAQNGVSFQVNAVVDATGTITANYGIKAVGTTQGITLTGVAITAGTYSSQNAVSLTVIGGGTAGSEVVTVVGSAITVKVASGTSTVTQVRTALNASAPAAALITFTGTSASTVSTAALVNINSMTTPTVGIDTLWNTTTGVITATAHGMLTGQVVTLTTSSGSLPTGFATSTNYYVFFVNTNQIQLFDTAAHALAATYNNSGYSVSTGVIVPTADGTAGAHGSIIPTSVSGASYKIQWSNDYATWTDINGVKQESGNWFDAVTAETSSVITQNITATGTNAVSAFNDLYAYARILFAISAGSIQVNVIAHSK